MATNYKIWKKQISNAARELTLEEFTLFQQKVALDAFSMVVKASPVGNPELWKNMGRDRAYVPPGYVGGQFRGNWQVSINSFDGDTIIDTVDRSGNQTIAREVPKIGSAQPFAIFYLHNNLPYAQRLENGWSTQAPKGMVAVTLQNIATRLGG